MLKGKKYVHFQTSASVCVVFRCLNAPWFLKRIVIRKTVKAVTDTRSAPWLPPLAEIHARNR